MYNIDNQFKRQNPTAPIPVMKYFFNISIVFDVSKSYNKLLRMFFWGLVVLFYYLPRLYQYQAYKN